MITSPAFCPVPQKRANNKKDRKSKTRSLNVHSYMQKNPYSNKRSSRLNVKQLTFTFQPLCAEPFVPLYLLRIIYKSSSKMETTPKKPTHTTLNTFSKLKKLSHLHSQLPGCKLPAESALSQLPNTFKCCKWFKQKYFPQDFPWSQDSNYGELYRPKHTQWITLRNVVETMKCGT